MIENRRVVLVDLKTGYLVSVLPRRNPYAHGPRFDSAASMIFLRGR
jgi:hypothetical protein